jgi:hypothetical protein
MLTDKQIEELLTCDCDQFIDNLVKEMASLSISNNLLEDIISVSEEPIKSDLLEAISRIRDQKIDNILIDKNEEH